VGQEASTQETTPSSETVESGVVGTALDRPRFSGEYLNAIDAKSRVLLPAPFRPWFEKGGKLALWKGPCLAAMPLDEWDRYEAGLKRHLVAQREEHPDELLRTMWRFANDLRLDIQGRLVLSPAAREQAGIGDEVRIVGFGRRVELWAAEVSAELEATWADHLATLSVMQAYHDVADVMGS
jgi:MraZ protein